MEKPQDVIIVKRLSSMTTIIGQNSEVEYTRKRMIHIAKDMAKKGKCTRCGEGDLNVAVLHEFGDPYLPSSIHFHCKKCNHTDPFMVRPIEDATRYAQYIMKQSGGPMTEQQKTDAMINNMIAEAKKKKITNRQEANEKVIQDENNEFIAGADEVAAKDKRKAD